MSDLEEDHIQREEEEDPTLRVEGDDEEERSRVKKHHKRRDEEELEDDQEDEEDDEEDDEDDEDDEEDDEDPGEARGKKRRKRHKRPAVNRFLDLVADVDDEEDDEEEEEEYAKDDGFLEETGQEGEDLEDMNRRAADHARLDRRQQELTDQDLARIAQDVTRRYKPTAQRYTGDMNEIPQRLLMPSVQDANLWQVRVKPGKERELVFSLMRKAMDQEFTARPLQILSAFQRDSLPGIIYVEARSSQQVSQAINGLVGVFPSRGIVLVPIEEMASLLQLKKKDTTVTPGTWVRIKRGKYSGDLAQVIDIAENGEEVGLKFVPRIDLNPKDDLIGADGKKRKLKSSGMALASRPPQRLFNYEEVIKAHGRRAVAKRNQVYVFANDTYRDGFIEKDFKLTALLLENVNPTLDEIMRFSRQEDGTENETNVDLSIIAETAKKEAIQVLQPGDHVEVFEGEQTGVHGVVDSIANDVVALRVVGVDIEGQKIDVPARSVRKRFKPGDHVKVMSGKNADETGLVVSVVDNVVTFLSDMSMQEVSVFSRDLREAAEVGSSTNVVGNYELHDLVQLDLQTVGVIFKTELDSFRVLDQTGSVRLVQPHQISMRRDSKRAFAMDSEGHELRVGDNVKEFEGENRKGQVLHIHQSFYAFLFNREIAENNGVFVTRARALVSLAPKGDVAKPGNADLSKMNPAMTGGAAGGGTVGSQMGRGPRDRLLGVHVSIVQGPNKGYKGIIKDTNGPIARVELQASNKIITIDKSKLRRRNPNGTLEALEGRGRGLASLLPPSGAIDWSVDNPWGAPPTGTPTTNPYNAGVGKTPAWGAGRTPNPYATSDSRTPAWSAGKTPNPYADPGSKTPAWNANSNASATNNARTPAWAPPARTPNPYASESWAGARTPQPEPERRGQWGTGAQTPVWRPDQPIQWTTDEPISAPTPAAWTSSVPMPAPLTLTAPMPATLSTSAPTPGVFNMSDSIFGRNDPWMSVDTPAVSAPTPSAGFYLNARDEEPAPATYEQPDDIWWILDEDVRIYIKDIVVDIYGTNVTGQKWHDGEYENKQATVIGVINKNNDKKLSLVVCKVHPERTKEIRIPAEFCYPHPPGPGDYCMVMRGRLKNTFWRLYSVDGTEAVLEGELGVDKTAFNFLARIDKKAYF